MSHTLVVSDHIVDELLGYLRIYRPKVSQKWIRGLREELRSYCYDYNEDSNLTSRDPKDNPVLALAKAQKAFIISGDKDLLEYDGVTPPVLSIGEYTELFMTQNS